MHGLSITTKIFYLFILKQVQKYPGTTSFLKTKFICLSKPTKNKTSVK